MLIQDERFSRITHWTEGALACYERNCVCKGCLIKEAYFADKQCFMKLAVIESVKKFGKPKHIQKKEIIED